MGRHIVSAGSGCVPMLLRTCRASLAQATDMPPRRSRRHACHCCDFRDRVRMRSAYAPQDCAEHRTLAVCGLSQRNAPSQAKNFTSGTGRQPCPGRPTQRPRSVRRMPQLTRGSPSGYNRRLRSVAQPGSASDLGSEGRRFESYRSDQFLQCALVLQCDLQRFCDVLQRLTLVVWRKTA